MAATKQKEVLALPHWDMTPVFPSLDSPEFEAAFRRVVSSVGALRARFDVHGVRRRESGEIDDATAESFEEITGQINALQDEIRTVSAYISSFVATDSRNDLAQARASELQRELVELTKLGTRYRAWVGSLDVDGLIGRSRAAADHAFALRKAQVAARHQMSEPEEDLTAALSLSGSTAWGKLHGNVTSLLAVPVRKPDGSTEVLPMSAVRGLAHDPDPEVRRLAYEAELEGWKTVEVPLAAALNSIKGEANTLNAQRGWKDSLEVALFANNIDRATLEAMQAACAESFPDFRRYLKAKARLLGKETMAWWDIFAPVGDGESQKRWDFDEAAAFVVEQFGTYSDRLAGLAGRAFRESWVDAEPRVGKRDGAFCMGVRGEESRVMCNFEPSLDGVLTLAHELGHAYHNLNLAQRTPMQRATPMALAETASIFCQTIVTNAVMAASGTEKLSVLEGDLQDACQVVVDIHSRFLFEKGVFEGRVKRELSVEELKTLMLDAQRQTYGDGLDPDALHPYMWAVKGHYYGASYYNFPYTFGLLFGLGLYALYLRDPDGFRASYDDLLSSTGLDDAASLTGRFGFDVRSIEFWRSSLDVVRERVAEFDNLIP